MKRFQQFSIDLDHAARDARGCPAPMPRKSR
jgi:hypothetical protein